MKYFYATILSIFLTSTFTYAQSNLKPGYIISLKGDTIQGLVDYREWDQTPDNVSFKTAGDATAKKYTLAEVNGFGVTGNAYFVKFKLPISYDYTDVNRITSRVADSTAVHTVFLKVVATGSVANLYSYTDLIKTRFFLEDRASKNIEELTYHVYYTDGNTNLPKKINRYKQQLQVLAQNNKTNNAGLTTSIENARYNETDLTGIIQTINQNKGTTFVAEKLFTARLFVGLGYNHSSIQYSGTETDFINGQSSSSSSPRPVLGIDLIFNKNTQRLFLRVDASYTRGSYTFSQKTTESTFYSKQNTVTISPQIVYSVYSKDYLKIFVNIGLAYNINSYDNYFLVKRLNGDVDKETRQFPSLEKTVVSLPVKLGAIFSKHLEVSACYITGSQMSVYPSASFSKTSFQAGISYLF